MFPVFWPHLLMHREYQVASLVLPSQGTPRPHTS